MSKAKGDGEEESGLGGHGGGGGGERHVRQTQDKAIPSFIPRRINHSIPTHSGKRSNCAGA